MNTEKHKPQFRPVQLYLILACALVLITIGIILIITDIEATGINMLRGGKSAHLTGHSITIIGILLATFPTYHLVKKNK